MRLHLKKRVRAGEEKSAASLDGIEKYARMACNKDSSFFSQLLTKIDSFKEELGHVVGERYWRQHLFTGDKEIQYVSPVTSPGNNPAVPIGLAFSPSGTIKKGYLAAAFSNNSLKVWNLSNNETIVALPEEPDVDALKYIQIGFIDEDRLLVCLGRSVRTFSINARKFIHDHSFQKVTKVDSFFESHEEPHTVSYCQGLSSNSRYAALIVSDDPRVAKIVDLNDPEGTHYGHSFLIKNTDKSRPIDISPDGKQAWYWDSEANTLMRAKRENASSTLEIKKIEGLFIQNKLQNERFEKFAHDMKRLYNFTYDKESFKKIAGSGVPVLSFFKQFFRAYQAPHHIPFMFYPYNIYSDSPHKMELKKIIKISLNSDPLAVAHTPDYRGIAVSFMDGRVGIVSLPYLNLKDKNFKDLACHNRTLSSCIDRALYITYGRNFRENAIIGRITIGSLVKKIEKIIGKGTVFIDKTREGGTTLRFAPESIKTEEQDKRINELISNPLVYDSSIFGNKIKQMIKPLANDLQSDVHLIKLWSDSLKNKLPAGSIKVITEQLKGKDFYFKDAKEDQAIEKNHHIRKMFAEPTFDDEIELSALDSWRLLDGVRDVFERCKTIGI